MAKLAHEQRTHVTPTDLPQLIRLPLARDQMAGWTSSGLYDNEHESWASEPQMKVSTFTIALVLIHSQCQLQELVRP